MNIQPETIDNQQTETQPDKQQTGKNSGLWWLLLLAPAFGLAWQYQTYEENQKAENEKRELSEEKQRATLPHRLIIKKSKTMPDFRNYEHAPNVYVDNGTLYPYSWVEINPDYSPEKYFTQYPEHPTEKDKIIHKSAEFPPSEATLKRSFASYGETPNCSNLQSKTNKPAISVFFDRN